MKDIKHFLSILDLSASEVEGVFTEAKKLKQELKDMGENQPRLSKKTLVMIFEKPSLRTKLSFAVGMAQLGGQAVYLGPTDIGLGTRETVADIAKVASSMGDCLMARTCKHETVRELADYSTVPVINGLSDLEHPCQILADFLTILEIKGRLKGLTLAYVGDGENNVTHSLALGCGLLGMSFKCASPRGFTMKEAVAEVIDGPQSVVFPQAANRLHAQKALILQLL